MPEIKGKASAVADFEIGSADRNSRHGRSEAMAEDFTHSVLGRTGLKVFRLGLSATYRPGKEAIHYALDAGINYFFCYGFDGQMIGTLRSLFKTRRDQLVVSTGAYNLLVGHPDLRRTLEKRLRQLGTDYIDVFLFLGVTNPKHLGARELEEMARFREEGKVRAIGISCHDRKFVGKLVAERRHRCHDDALQRGAPRRGGGHLPAPGGARSGGGQLYGDALELLAAPAARLPGGRAGSYRGSSAIASCSPTPTSTCV